MAEAILNNHANANPPLEGAHSYGELRLLSVNEARKMLGIRHETLKRIINEGKINVIIIEGNIKVPIINIRKYITEYSRPVKSIVTETRGKQLTTSISDIVQEIIKKHK